MPGGYMGKLLFVDLTRGEVKEEPLDEKLCRDFIGGYGLGARIMYSRQKGGADPLGPDNIFGVVTGPLTGSTTCWGNRYAVMAKSPLTGAWGDANCGGEFGPFLKFAGYDAVFFSGVSEKPVYLLCKDGTAELRDAASIWGKDTRRTEALLKSELGDGLRIAGIGPAGEKLALLASVMTDNFRAAARAGLGAVMGSKRLKAVVVMGNKTVPIADKKALSEATKKFLGYIKTSPVAAGHHEYGTCGGVAPFVAIGICPVKNWGGIGTLDFPNAGAIGGDSVIALQYRRHGCWRCPNPCGGLMAAGKQYEYPKGVYKPEYETIAAFGSMCLNDNMESIVMATDICNLYGIDTMSAGATIAFAIECYENGIITKTDTDGVELTWGNHPAIIAMLSKMVRREGFGDMLADGVKVASEKIGRGAEQYAIHVHGQEPAYHDPRFAPSFATGYVVDAEPGRHTQAGLAPPEEGLPVQGLELPPMDKYTYTGKGHIEAELRNLQHITNASGVCYFGSWIMPREAIPTLLSAVTGWQFSTDELVTTGERVSAIRQAFTLRERLRPPKDFKLEGRPIGSPPQKEGPVANVTVDVKALSDDYYRAMDWDPETGVPSKKKLMALGLDDIAAEEFPG